MMNKVLEILTRLERVLMEMLDNGVSETLIDEVRRQIRKGRRVMLRELRKRIGPVDRETRKWLAMAVTLVSTARALILLRR